MKTFIKYCCLFLFLTNLSMPQWRWMNPTPQGNKLNDVVSIGSGKSISVGNLGTIIRSEEWGDINTIIDNQYTNRLTKICRTPAGTLMTVGQNGIILMSVNEGISWQIVNTQFNETFMDVSFINNSIGYIISYEGKILKTINGGFSWTQQINPIISNLFSFSMVNENVGFISGNHGLILKTTDGGNNWQKLSSFTSANIIKVQAVDENNIFCASINDSLYKSTDGGNNWNCIFNLIRFGFKDIQFLTPEIGFIVGATVIYRTSNGIGFTKVLDTESYDDLTSINYYDQSNAFVVGERGLMLKSTSGGFQWLYISKNIYKDYSPRYIKFINDSTGLIISSKDKVFRTTDGGRHWTSIEANIYYFVRNADFFDDNFGLVISDVCGRISKTTDFGLTWTHYGTIGCDKNFNAVEILDQDTAVAVGYDSSDPVIFRSTSSGINWNRIPISAPGILNDVSFWNKNNGVSVGNNGTILKTTNSGITWQEIPFVNNNNIYSVQCAGTDTFFLLSAGAYIYKSMDGGNSFFMLPINIPGGIRQIKFNSSNMGIAVGPNGQVFRTIDGGMSWEDLSFRSYESVDYIDIISDNHFAVGSIRYNLLMYGGDITSIDDQGIVSTPTSYMLYQNYPNPFNPVTTIKYTIPNVTLSLSSRAESRDEGSRVTLKVYDILGSEVATLVNEEQPAGNYEIKFDSHSGSVRNLGSGVYFYQLKAGSFVETKKMILLK